MISAIPPGDRDRTHIIGRSQGYLGLAVNFGTYHDPVQKVETPRLRTAWTPTPDELAKLNAGGSVVFELINIVQHPPCKAWVTEGAEPLR